MSTIHISDTVYKDIELEDVEIEGNTMDVRIHSYTLDNHEIEIDWEVDFADIVDQLDFEDDIFPHFKAEILGMVQQRSDNIYHILRGSFQGKINLDRDYLPTPLAVSDGGVDTHLYKEPMLGELTYYVKAQGIPTAVADVSVKTEVSGEVTNIQFDCTDVENMLLQLSQEECENVIQRVIGQRKDLFPPKDVDAAKKVAMEDLREEAS